jgi:hypothetical protein
LESKPSWKVQERLNQGEATIFLRACLANSNLFFLSILPISASIAIKVAVALL